jgi:hypothetical protein
MFNINDVLAVAPDRFSIFEGTARIVAISTDGAHVALMRLDTPQLHTPFIRSSEDINLGLDVDKSLVRLSEFDTGLPLSLSSLSAKRHARVEGICDLMQPLLGDDLLILDENYRSRRLAQVAREKHFSQRTLRRYLYQYLWGGMVDRAFVGRITKTRAKQKLSGKRRGPKVVSRDASQVCLPAVRALLEKGAKDFKKLSFREAFIETKKKFFSRGKKAAFVGGKRRLEEVLLPPKNLPTRRQFRYVRDQMQVLRKSVRTNIQQKQRDTVRRGTARKGVHGPGWRYEIDATKIQVRLVSRYGPRRHMVREATLYIIIDVFSGAIVGYALSLENASWALAAKALRNCFTKKSVVFKRLGLPYTDRDWPSAHLPSRLTADRGEFISNKAGVVPGTGIKLEICPAMRPERKGTVEGKFNSTKHNNRYYKMPGKHRKAPQRREKDGKESAAFTLFELEQRIVEIILDLNGDPVPIQNMPAEAIQAGVDAITYIGLFAWGLEHRTGFTRTLPEKDIFTALMMRGVGVVSSDGIRFKKQTFFASKLNTLGLTGRASRNGTFNIDILYDEHFANAIWFYDEAAREWTPATNNSEDVIRLSASFWEAAENLQKASALHTEAKDENIHKRGDKAKRLNSSADCAAEEAALARRDVPKSKAKSDIRVNTAIDKRTERLIQGCKDLDAFSPAARDLRPDDPVEARPSSANIDVARSLDIGQRSLALWRSLK